MRKKSYLLLASIFTVLKRRLVLLDCTLHMLRPPNSLTELFQQIKVVHTCAVVFRY